MAPEVRTERELSLDFLRVTEAAAIAAARTMGQGDRKYSDQVAVEAMREVMDSVPMRGRIVIGEGERDEAPMLFIGEEVGGGFGVGEELAEPFRSGSHWSSFTVAGATGSGTHLSGRGVRSLSATSCRRVESLSEIRHRFRRNRAHGPGIV